MKHVSLTPIIIGSHVASILVGMVLAAVIGAKMTQQDPGPKVVDAYKQGTKEALTIRSANVDLELTCAALWQSNQPFLGEQK
jgi:hypothetical protein